MRSMSLSPKSIAGKKSIKYCAATLLYKIRLRLLLPATTCAHQISIEEVCPMRKPTDDDKKIPPDAPRNLHHQEQDISTAGLTPPTYRQTIGPVNGLHRMRIQNANMHDALCSSQVLVRPIPSCTANSCGDECSMQKSHSMDMQQCRQRNQAAARTLSLLNISCMCRRSLACSCAAQLQAHVQLATASQHLVHSFENERETCKSR